MNILPSDNLNISAIVSELEQGKTIVYPTETTYGLGCDATNEEAVNRIFDIKQRQREKSLLIIVPARDMMYEYIEHNPTIEKLANRYWPGPLTVVTHIKPDKKLASGVVRDDGTIAFRISSHPIAAELARKLGKPLVSTSANIAAQKSPYDSDEVTKTFQKQEIAPDIFINAGILPEKAPSTIVRVDGNRVTVLRQGDIIIDNMNMYE